MMYELNDLVRLMVCLRDVEYGCPWDRKQSFQSIVPFTLEEAYEVADVVERQAFEELPSELGDLLFQVVFYARLAEEQSLFSLQHVIHSTVVKLLARHPHVFPNATFESFGQKGLKSLDEIKSQWERKKIGERAQRGQLDLFDDVPQVMPALTRAQKIQKRAKHIGFDWPDLGGVIEKVAEEFAELSEAYQANETDAIREEFGDLIFTLVSLARHLNIDSEQALRQATLKFERRIGRVMKLAQARGINLTIATANEREALWVQAKTLDDRINSRL